MQAHTINVVEGTGNRRFSPVTLTMSTAKLVPSRSVGFCTYLVIATQWWNSFKLLTKCFSQKRSSENFSEDRFCKKHFVRSLKEFHHCVSLAPNVEHCFGWRTFLWRTWLLSRVVFARAWPFPRSPQPCFICVFTLPPGRACEANDQRSAQRSVRSVGISDRSVRDLRSTGRKF